MRRMKRAVGIAVAALIAVGGLCMPLLLSWRSDAIRQGELSYSQATPAPFAFVRKPANQLVELVAQRCIGEYLGYYNVEIEYYGVYEHDSKRMTQRDERTADRARALYTQCGLDGFNINNTAEMGLHYQEPAQARAFFKLNTLQTTLGDNDSFEVGIDEYSDAIMVSDISYFEDFWFYNEVMARIYSSGEVEELKQRAHEAQEYYYADAYELSELLTCPQGSTLYDMVQINYDYTADMFGMDISDANSRGIVELYKQLLETLAVTNSAEEILENVKKTLQAMQDEPDSEYCPIVGMMIERMNTYNEYGIEELRERMRSGAEAEAIEESADAAYTVTLITAQPTLLPKAQSEPIPLSPEQSNAETSAAASASASPAIVSMPHFGYADVYERNVLHTAELSEFIYKCIAGAVVEFPEFSWLINEPVPQQSMLNWAGYTLDASVQPECGLVVRDGYNNTIVLHYPSLQHTVGLDVYISTRNVVLALVPGGK